MSKMFSAKFLDLIRNLKSDAVPRPPRSQQFCENVDDTQNENINSSNTPEEHIFSNDNEKKGKKKSKFKMSFSQPNTEDPVYDDSEDRRSSSASSVVHTQTNGNVINIVNASNVRWGNEFVYYLGPVNGHSAPPNTPMYEEEKVEKDNLITLLMESKEKHDYINYISNNLGKNWYSIFKSLGYSRGQIETAEIDTAKNGVAEARYKLLLDWIRNDDDGTLGKLATVLWTEGERHIVKELAAMYHSNKHI
ncbi:unnamed protein product [Leptidea sinapis]|uniref:Death domain-containing protein n=1 Tax=Leptidea sinapis TaxID=189913 RepID=A0A5E4QBT2_9NEOP|nr:unnamed protein product [Leptidea sinapis]